MSTPKNIVVIDDNGDLYASLDQLFAGNTGIQVTLTGSSDDELRDNLSLEDYMIIINYTGLKAEIRQLVTDLYNRNSYCITPIIVATDEAYPVTTEQQMIVPIVSVLRKTYDPIALRHHLTNIIDTIESNRDLNALSGLPGNNVINRRLQECIDGGRDFAMMYIDLDNFKEYNEYYGFYQGDQVLLFLTRILYEAMLACGADTDFIGHVGGDDFIMILEHTDVVKEIGDRIIASFDAKIREFYHDEDVKNGYIDARNRKGEIERINIMSISIVTMYAEEFHTLPVDEVYKKMMYYKKQAKLVRGSVLIDNNR